MSVTECPPNDTMDLVVRTLYRTLVLTGVDGNSAIVDLKDMLYKRGLQEHIPIPIGLKQRLVRIYSQPIWVITMVSVSPLCLSWVALKGGCHPVRQVFKGSVLTSGSLSSAGVRAGDHLVLLHHRPHTSTSDRPVDMTPVPNSGTIRNAIMAEARRRGIESTVTNEPFRTCKAMAGLLGARADILQQHTSMKIETLHEDVSLPHCEQLSQAVSHSLRTCRGTQHLSLAHVGTATRCQVMY